MGINAVIDTNVWISALLNPHGHPALLRASFEAGKFQAVISPPLLEELVDVLQRPRIKDKYRIRPEDIEELVVLIEERRPLKNVPLVIARRPKADEAIP